MERYENSAENIISKGSANKDALLAEIRISLQANSESKTQNLKPITVQTVVISHPDAGHSCWLFDLFSDANDSIKHLILGGWPCHYALSIEVLHSILDKGTIIYFPAIVDGTITAGDHCKLMAAMNAPDPSATSVNLSPHYCYYQDSVQYPHEIPEFLNAFNFDNQLLKVFCLSVNASHYDNFGTTFSHRYIDDDDSDCIVLKICFGGASAIIAGDATFLTKQRILRQVHATEIQANALISSHHGPCTHG